MYLGSSIMIFYLRLHLLTPKRVYVCAVYIHTTSHAYMFIVHSGFLLLEREQGQDGQENADL